MKTRLVTDVSQFAQMGMAAMIPGLQYAVQMMQRNLDEFRQQLVDLQTGSGKTDKMAGLALEGLVNQSGNGSGKRRGRPPGQVATSGNSWANLSPKEHKARSAKMAAARWGKKNVKPSHPRDADHPDHEKYLKKLRAGVKRRYANMTDEQKRATIAPALAARKAVAA